VGLDARDIFQVSNRIGGQNVCVFKGNAKMP
jgi:hypothetical protein